MPKHWSETEIQYLKDNFHKKTTEEIANDLNRGSRGVHVKALSLGLKRRKLKRWTKDEDEFLKSEYPTKGIVYCAECLNRSEHSISKRAEAIGLRRQCPYHKFTKEFLETEYIEKRKSIINIAAENNVNFWDVHAALIKCGIEIDKKGLYYGDRHHNWKGFGEISQYHWGGIVRCAEDRNLDFNITIEDAWSLFLKQDRKCALSGVDLQFSKTSSTQSKDTTASLDRINSNLGYTIENIQWVHKEINHMKWHFSQEKFISWCKLVTKNEEAIQF